uniref:Uncharacterized protein n=1 Tax=Leersia perrieri TaxID=77586 RepID=A0A0D9W6K9_9ORYZ
MAPIAPRGGDSSRSCTAAVATNGGGVRLRRRGFVLCAIDRHGVRLAVSGQFLSKSDLRRLYELCFCLRELLLVQRPAEQARLPSVGRVRAHAA